MGALRKLTPLQQMMNGSGVLPSATKTVSALVGCEGTARHMPVQAFPTPLAGHALQHYPCSNRKKGVANHAVCSTAYEAATPAMFNVCVML